MGGAELEDQRTAFADQLLRVGFQGRHLRFQRRPHFFAQRTDLVELRHQIVADTVVQIRGDGAARAFLRERQLRGQVAQFVFFAVQRLVGILQFRLVEKNHGGHARRQRKSDRLEKAAGLLAVALAVHRMAQTQTIDDDLRPTRFGNRPHVKKAAADHVAAANLHDALVRRIDVDEKHPVGRDAAARSFLHAVQRDRVERPREQHPIHDHGLRGGAGLNFLVMFAIIYFNSSALSMES